VIQVLCSSITLFCFDPEAGKRIMKHHGLNGNPYLLVTMAGIHQVTAAHSLRQRYRAGGQRQLCSQ